MIMINILHLIVYLLIIIPTGYGKNANKLIGGNAVIVEHYSHLVSVLWKNDHVCNGNIITQYHVITTASCVTNDKNIIYSNLQILSGTDYKNNYDGHGEINDIELIIFHNNYEPRQFWVNDICILKLEKPIIFSMIRNKVNIFIPGPRRDKRRHFSLIGWQNFYDVSDRISKIDITLKMKEDCKMFYGEFAKIYNGQKCFITYKETQKITHGDSGNPVLNFMDRKLHGLASLVPIEPNNNYFIATHVSFYGEWIKKTVEKF